MALLNLFPCTLPSHGATMASHSHSWDGYAQIHYPHMCYHKIHELREFDPLIQSHTGKLCWLLSYCLKRERPLHVTRRSQAVNPVLEAGHLLSPTPLLHTLQLLWPLEHTCNFPYSHCLLGSFHDPKLLPLQAKSHLYSSPFSSFLPCAFTCLWLQTQGLIHTKHSATRPHPWLYSLLGTEGRTPLV